MHYLDLQVNSILQLLLLLLLCCGTARLDGQLSW